MKILFTFLVVCFTSFTVEAQSVIGQLTLNGKAQANLELKTNSTVQLFREFQTKKYALKFNFEATDIPQNIYRETVVFFDFITLIKKDGEVVGKLKRKQPIPYATGEHMLTAETFQFIEALAALDKSSQPTILKKDFQGTMASGAYTVELRVKPIDYKGKIAPVVFNFILRKRPGRTKY